MFSIVKYFLLGLFVFVGCYILYPYYRQWRYWYKCPSDKKMVPLVRGCLPLVGHGLAFSADIIGYIQNCYKLYGSVFRLQIFRSEFLVICDRSLLKEYFSQKEASFSLYDALRRIYFGEAFSERSDMLETIIVMVKSTVRIDFASFVPKIVQEAQTIVQSLREDVQKSSNKVFALKNEMIRFVARTSAKCFINVDLSEDFFDALIQFTNLLNKLVVLTYFMPRQIIKFIWGKQLCHYRSVMIRSLNDEIESYRFSKTKNDSTVFRTCVDHDQNLTNQEIAEVVICLLYVSSENTALGLVNCIIDLVEHPNMAKKMADGVCQFLLTKNYKGLFQDKFLNACVMESSRMNTHIFPINRRSRSKEMTLGNYFIGDTESVAVCEPMLMKDDLGASDVFQNPTTYDPDRFVSKNESMAPQDILTWGAGSHSCPGKQFAIYEIKVALALLFNNFKFDPVSIGDLQYFSPSAYAEREFITKILLQPELSFSSLKTAKLTNVQILTDENGEKLWLLKGFLDPTEQRQLFESTLTRCFDSNNVFVEKLLHGDISPKQAYPIGFENMIYTGPVKEDVNMDHWKEFAGKAWSMIKKDIGMEKSFDSVYAQMYSTEGDMMAHYDNHVNWGVSVSLGASCDFMFGETNSVRLDSGDVLICDFSKVKHAVGTIDGDNLPGFVDKGVLEDGVFTDFYQNHTEKFREMICHQNRVRMSIQIRDLTNCSGPNPLMTIDQFINMLCSSKKGKLKQQ